MNGLEKLNKYLSQEKNDLIEKCVQTDVMQRLRGIDMNCGMNYTSYETFVKMHPYSRLQHSINTAYTAAHFTQDPKVIIAALLHDISSPVFSHVIDFMHKDYETQESTESFTKMMIMNDTGLLHILEQAGLTVEDVADYHLYPIADNDTPRLSSDRLEYSLSNMINYGFASYEEARAYFEDLIVTTNEDGEEEIAFRSLAEALGFAHRALQCSYVYASDFDRYAMDYLADIVRDAYNDGVISESDLYTMSETAFIAKMCGNEVIKGMWDHFTQLYAVTTCKAGIPGSKVIACKKRYIDPLVNGLGRLSKLDQDFSNEIQKWMKTSFTHAVINK